MAEAPTIEYGKSRAEIAIALLNLFGGDVVKAAALFMKFPDSHRLMESYRTAPSRAIDLPVNADLSAWIRDQADVPVDAADPHVVALERGDREEGRLCMMLDKTDGPGFLATEAFELFKEHETAVLAETRRNMELESEIEKAREMSRAILEASPHAIVIVHRETGSIQHANSGFEELTGLAVDEVIGKSLWGLDAFLDSRRLQEALARSGSSRRPVSLRLTKRNAESLPMRVVTAFIDFDTACVVLADSSEPVALRAELLHAEKRSMIHGLLGKLVHDITNTLTAVSGFAQLLAARDDVSEDMKESVGQIVSETKHCRTFMQQLAEIATPVFHPHMRVDVRELIASAVDFASSNAKSHDIEVSGEPAHDLPAIKGDRRRLQCALDEAICNAFDSFGASDNTGRIVIRTRAEQDKVILEVEDNAGGAPEPEKAFEAFYTSRELPGHLGLGLTMIKAIAESHKGSASFENTQQGSLLRIVLPAV